jgi:hypothetical protein
MCNTEAAVMWTFLAVGYHPNNSKAAGAIAEHMCCFQTKAYLLVI